VLIKEIDNTGTVGTVRGQPLPNMSNNCTCVASAQRDGCRANIGGTLCSTLQSLADAHY